MTRKKSRPHHRENAADAPSNESGFYKMFWNSMETNHGTNGPNSPSQIDPVRSPAVIIINDSPVGSPCATEENFSGNATVPAPIKEEVTEDLDENPHHSLDSSPDTGHNFSESHSRINGKCDPHPTCLPSSCLTSQIPSKNSSLSVSDPSCFQEVENFQSTPTSKLTSISTSISLGEEFGESENIHGSSGTEHEAVLPEHLNSNQETLEENGHVICPSAENNQVRDSAFTENLVDVPVGKSSLSVEAHGSCTEFSQESASSIVNSDENPRSVNYSATSETPLGVGDADGVLEENLPNERLCVGSGGGVVNGRAMPDELVDSYEEIPEGNLVIAEGEDDGAFEDHVSGPPSPALSEGTGQALNLLKSLLAAREEDIEDITQKLADGMNEISEYTREEGEVNDDVESSPENNDSEFTSEVETEHIEPIPENVSTRVEGVATLGQSNGNVVDTEGDQFPIMSNFLPSKIKLDSVGVLRSLTVLREEVGSLYRKYLSDDVLLRTSKTQKNSSKADNQSPVHSPISTATCCVKMERLPDPFVNRNTVAISDATFRTWKRQIIRQRNEEKFRHLKVWRRGRTLLWRECELAGMDRGTYDSQVAYVKKHKFNETSSSESESSDDESGNEAEVNQSDSTDVSSANEDDYDDLSLTNPPFSPSGAAPGEAQKGIPLSVESQLDHNFELQPSPTVNEYVVERTDDSTAKTPTPLKITIRKTSMSKSEEDKDRSTDGEDNFTVPNRPSVSKPRSVATKRTFRRPSDPLHKRNSPPKSIVPESKKTKSSSVENEDLYDQSLLGRRSHEVENFNLLEKWDIPFEEPTLFRSPRVASRLAQLKTKEAFASSFKRTAPQKTPSLVTKEVKDVVEMLCTKTVEAMLFPESTGSSSKSVALSLKKPSSKSSAASEQTLNSSDKVSDSKKIVTPSEEPISKLDESSEMSHSETSSTLDASSDFGGSTTSLATEDSVKATIKSPPKRRRRRGTATWLKKKKVKGKGSTFQEVKEVSEKDETAMDEVRSSPLHTTQVPVVSEGPGQSPHESEDDAAHKVKDRCNPNPPPPTLHLQTHAFDDSLQKKVELKGNSDSPPNEGSKKEPNVSHSRITRSKHSSKELDPGLPKDFGSRKRKPVALDVSSESTERLKPNEELPKKPIHKESTPVSYQSSSATEKSSESDSQNTQVPEVSEGPGEVELESEEKECEWKNQQHHEPPFRVLRSRSKAQAKSSSTTAMNSNTCSQRTEHQASKSLKGSKEQIDEPLVLESPQSPTPETFEPEPVIIGRTTRSKKRRVGPAYVAVKSTAANDLPLVQDVVVEPFCNQRLQTLSGNEIPAPEVPEPPDVQTTAPSEVSELVPSLNEPLKPSEPEQPLDVPFEERSPATTTQASNPGRTEVPSAASPTKAVPSLTAQGSHSISGSCISDDIQYFSNSDGTLAPHSGAPETFNKGAGKPENVIASAAGVSLSSANSSSPLKDNEKIQNENSGVKNDSGNRVGSERMEVLDTLNSILNATVTKNIPGTISSASPSRSANLAPMSVNSSTLSVPSSSIVNVTTPFPNLAPLPTSFPSDTLPGTFLPYIDSTIAADLTRISDEYPNIMSPGDLVVDESPLEDLNDDDIQNIIKASETQGSISDMIKNSDIQDGFSDDETNQNDLADKIDKIVREQIQDIIPSQIPNVTTSKSKPLESTAETNKNAPILKRRDSIDERTGLPNTLIQRLRDPRIRSKLLSHLEEVESGNEVKTTSNVANVVASAHDLKFGTLEQPISRDPRAAKIGMSDPNQGGNDNHAVAAGTSICPVNSDPVTSIALLPGRITQPVANLPLQNCDSVKPGAANQSVPSQVLEPQILQPTTTPGTAVQQGLSENSENPEGVPDATKVDFLVPPSDDEEEESIKRRPKKPKKKVDVELMYKSPLEDLESEARPGYGERAPRRYSDNYSRRKIIGDERPRWDDRTRVIDRRSRRDDSFFDERSLREQRYPPNGHTRDRRFDERNPRDQSRDRMSYYDRSSREQRSYDDQRMGDVEPHHAVPLPYNQPVWPVNDLASSHHQEMISHPQDPAFWQQHYYPDNIHTSIQMVMPEPPKINYMETRLINLEVLPKTTNLDVPPVNKVYHQFDKDSMQLLHNPPPLYDPNEAARTITMLDPMGQEMIDVIQIPKPTSGLTREYFRLFPPELSIEDMVSYHYISPGYVAVWDDDDPPPILDDDDEDEGVEEKFGDKLKTFIKPAENLPELSTDPLKNILESLPLLKEQYSMRNTNTPIPPPPPNWNDVDLRVLPGSVIANETDSGLTGRNPSPPPKLRSKSKSPSKNRMHHRSHRSRSRSPRRRHRTRARSSSSDMSISSPSSTSPSPSKSRRRSRSPRRRRSRSKSSERPRKRRRSGSASPSKKSER